MSKLPTGEIDYVLDLVFKDGKKRNFLGKIKDQNPCIDVKPRLPTGEVPDYTKLLHDRHLFKNEFPGLKLFLVRWIRSQFTQRNMVVLLLIGIALIAWLSTITSCAVLNWFPGCRVHTRTEFYDLQVLGKLTENTSQYADPIIDRKATTPTYPVIDKKTVAPTENAPQNFVKNRVEISKSETFTHYFNIELFKNLVLAYSLILAFIRWHLTNLQSGMSEIFERKRSVNNLIMANKSDVEDLVSGALEFSNKPKSALLDGPICRERCAKIIHECAADTPFGDKGPSFIQQMFVYIELDNLELALKKYKDGYLEDEQMYRACEIFESRCMTKYFRFLAANQGLRNYTRGFHKLLVVLLIFGYYKEQIDKDVPGREGYAS